MLTVFSNNEELAGFRTNSGTHGYEELGAFEVESWHTYKNVIVGISF